MKKIYLFAILILLFLFPPFGGIKGGCQNIGINTDGSTAETGVMLDIKNPTAKATTAAVQTVFQLKSFDANTDALKLRLGFKTDATQANRYGFIDFPDFTASVPTYLPLCLQPSGGNVGIGTTAPAYKLDIVGDATLSSGGALRIKEASNVNWIYLAQVGTTGYLSVTNSGSFAINGSGGNVGIGTNSPSALLHLSSGSAQTNLKITNTVVPVDFSITVGSIGGLDRASLFTTTTHHLTLGTNSSSRLNIDGSGPNEGNVSIVDAILLGAPSRLTIYGKDGTNSPTFEIITKQFGTAAYQQIASIHPTGSTVNDGRFQLLDNAVAKVNIAANNSRGGDTYFNGGGFVGIGTTTPEALLNLVGTNAGILFGKGNDGTGSTNYTVSVRTSQSGDNTGNGRHLTIQAGATDNDVGKVGGNLYLQPGPPSAPSTVYGNVLIATGGGNVGIGTTSPTDKFQVYNGTTTGTYTSTGWAHSSDARLKTNVVPIEKALNKVMNLNGVYFNWKNADEPKRQMGFIAQEVEKVIPEVVIKDAEGKYSMVYENITAVLVEAVKELAKQNEQLLKQNEQLLKKVERLEKQQK